jgi:phosphinothricin acetyltransferase
MTNISALLPAHWLSVKNIYEQGIATGNATFQTAAPSWQEWDTSHINACRLVAIVNHEVVGWAALSQVSSRCVYAGVAELSLYIRSNARGKGIGNLLLEAIISESEKEGYWTLQSGIFPENIASLHIHQKNGFRIIGFREKVGKMGNNWRDNIILERRSKTVGV